MPNLSRLQQKQKIQRRYLATLIMLTLTLAALIWPAHIATFAWHEQQAQTPVISNTSWRPHNSDLLYVVSYSQKEQP